MIRGLHPLEHFIESDTASLLQNLAAQAGPKLHEMPVNEARADVRALTQYCDLPCPTACVTQDLPRSGELPVPIRLYSPAADTSGPVIVFVHGGGFVLGDLETYDAWCSHLCTRSGMRVIAPDYRLAPEHPFPAAYNDVMNTLSWVLSNPQALGAPASAVALAGDSAGAALSASCAATWQGGSERPVQALLMLYPVTDLSAKSASYKLFQDGYLLESAAMDFFIRSYTPDVKDRKDPRASPLLSQDLSHMPPTTLMTCGLDVLRDEGRAFAGRLIAAGIEIYFREATGHIHGIATLRGALPSARPVIDESIDSFVRQISRSARRPQA
jgi:acetyl esterase